MSRCQNDPALLAGSDAGCCAAKVAAGAQAHFNEDQHLAITADQVNLATPDAEISFYDAYTVAFEILRCERFCFAAACGGGIVGLCLHARKK